MRCARADVFLALLFPQPRETPKAITFRCCPSFMKSIRLVFFAAALACSSIVAHAQLIFSGHVTSATGSYDGTFAVGDAVVLSMDFSHSAAFGDLLHGMVPGEARYLVTSTLTVGGTAIPLASDVNNVAVNVRSAPPEKGLSIRTGWGPSSAGVTFFQDFFSNHDIIPALNEIPADIPFSELYSTAGYLAHYYVTDPGFFHYTARLDWELTAYSGSVHVDLPPVFPAVPEPSTMGLVAACSLGIFALLRRELANRRSKRGGKTIDAHS
jgi:hypothetical protein